MNSDQELYIINETFSDAHKLTSVLRGWEIEFVQLEKGKYEGEVLQVGNAATILSHFKSNKQIEITGNAPKEMRTFGIPLHGSFPIIWKDHTITQKRIQTYSPGVFFKAVIPAGFETFTISIEKTLFEKHIKSIDEFEEINSKIEDESLQCSVDSIDGMHDMLLKLIETISMADNKLTDAQLTQLLNYEIPERLIDIVSSSIPVKSKPSSDKQKLALDNFLLYLNENPDDSITVLDYCEKTGISKRTLEYAVQNKFNTSPKKYINALMLNNVKKELFESDSSSIRIADVAHKHGFWHMSQFAKDYKEMFGELPSITLSQK